MKFGWAAGAFPQAISSYAFSVLLFRYLTDTVGIAAAMVGSIIALSKIYDALIDPTIGFVSDRLKTPMGGRRPLMLAGGLLLAASMALLFHIPPDAAMSTKFVLIIVGLLLYSSGYSLFAIPWLAMSAEIAADYHERTSMMAWRLFFATSGQAAGSLGGPMLLALLGIGAVAYGRMGLLIATVTIVATVLTISLTRAAHPLVSDPVESAKARLFQQLREAFRNKPFVILIMLKGAIYFGGGVHAGALAIFVSKVLRASDVWLGVISLCGALAAVGSQPFWVWLSRRQGKRPALGCALVLQAIGMGGFFVFGPSTPMPLILAMGIILGLANGGVFMLAQSMLPDIIEYDYCRTGHRRAGAFAGAVSFLETCCGALGALVLGLILSGTGYISGVHSPETGQPAAAVLGLRVACGLVPALSALLGLVALLRYDLTERRLVEAMRVRAGQNEAIAPPG